MNMRLHVRKICVWAGIAVFVMGCGGGGGGGNAGGGGLQGTMNVSTFLIPAGTTRTVTGDLVVHATASIEIDGTLIIPEGFNVAMVSDGSFVNKGIIEPPATPATNSAREHSVVRGGSTNLVFGAGGKGTIDLGSINAPGGCNLNIAGTKFNSSITAKQLTTQDGADAPNAVTSGSDAGNIEIGTTNANNLAAQAGLSNTDTPVDVSIGAIVTGDGGKGFSDMVGKQAGNILTLRGTAGGNGGNITIDALGTLTIPKCQAGNGGKGGAASFQFQNAATADGAKGISITANIGGGGNGGSIVSNPALPTAIAGAAGQAGTAAGVAKNLIITAQGGGPDGGSGGDVLLIAGPTGSNGAGPNVAPALASITVVSNPGTSTASEDSNHPGGNGGNVTLQAAGGGAVRSVGTIVTANSGSDGYAPSCSVNNAQAGTNGGNGTVITANGTKYTSGGNPANGGNGGSGKTAGAGGNAAKDDAGNTFGSPGKAGMTCGATQGAMLYQTAPLPGAPAFCFLDKNSGYLLCTAAEIQQTNLSYYNLVNGQTGVWPVFGSLPDNQNNLTTSSATQRGSGVIYAASTDHTIKILNDSTGSQIGTIQVPNQQYGPAAIGYEASTGRLYVAVDQGVDVFDTKNNNNLIGTISSTVTGASAMAINSTNHRLYLLKPTITFDAGTVSVMDTSALQEITQIPLPDYSGVIALDPVTGNAFVSLYNQGKIVEISPTSNSIVNTVQVGSNPWGIEVDSSRGRVFVVNYNYSQTNPQPGSVTELNESNLSTITTVTVGKGPTGLAIDETGDLIYVANSLDNTVSILKGN